MRALDYILYITHSFLLIVKKLNNEDIEGRAKNALALMLFFPSLLLFFFVYMISISTELFSYNKIVIFIFTISIFLTLRYLIFKRYKTQYYEVVDTLKKQYSYNNKRIVFSFLILWFIPIFSFWIGVIILRQFIYHA